MESKLSTAFLLVPLALQPVKEAHFPCAGSRTGGSQHLSGTTHSLGRISAHVISLFLWVSTHNTGPNRMASLPTQFHMDISYRLGCRSLFPSLQLVSSENCSTCTASALHTNFKLWTFNDVNVHSISIKCEWNWSLPSISYHWRSFSSIISYLLSLLQSVALLASSLNASFCMPAVVMYYCTFQGTVL